MEYLDIVECIKFNQLKQCISVRVLAARLNIHPQVLTDIRGYRYKVSASLFDNILNELSVFTLSASDKSLLLNTQQKAQEYKHKKYIKSKKRRID